MRHRGGSRVFKTFVPLACCKLYFSEDREDLRTPGKPARYFITVEGKAPALFDMNFKQYGYHSATGNRGGLGHREPRA